MASRRRCQNKSFRIWHEKAAEKYLILIQVKCRVNIYMYVCKCGGMQVKKVYDVDTDLVLF